jgi:hypothetical protein
MGLGQAALPYRRSSARWRSLRPPQHAANDGPLRGALLPAGGRPWCSCGEVVVMIGRVLVAWSGLSLVAFLWAASTGEYGGLATLASPGAGTSSAWLFLLGVNLVLALGVACAVLLRRSRPHTG